MVCVTAEKYSRGDSHMKWLLAAVMCCFGPFGWFAALVYLVGSAETERKDKRRGY
jgi:hypothetical protein